MKLICKLSVGLACMAASGGLRSSATARSADPLAVKTGAGPVEGTMAGGIQSWLGIPFAAPPVGPLRWQPPRPPRSWTVTMKANTLPPACAQNADLGPFARAGGSEDCLYLNVYRSAAAAQPASKLPVFVWIHGGALQVGQGADYAPTKLAAEGRAVVVTLNYRLGAFGFLANPDLDREGHAFANYGLLDQQAALRWVRDNIAGFGGDPANVSIAGESSGGNSVILQMVSPGAAGLFQHAVSMSGGGAMGRYPAFGSLLPLAPAEKLGQNFAASVGCTTGGSACLRALSAKRILDAQTPYILNEAIIDGGVVAMHPADAFRIGRFNRVTLINGSTHDEGRFFVALAELLTGKPMTAADYPAALAHNYGAALAPKVMHEYALDRYDSASVAFAATVTDSLFACTALAIDRSLAGQIPVYAYEFNDGTAPSYVEPTTFPLLASHTYELSYVFPGFHGGGDVPVRLNPLQDHLSDQMVDLLANLGSLPNREGTWQPFDRARNNMMTFILPAGRMVSGRFVDDHHCAFWDRAGIY